MTKPKPKNEILPSGVPPKYRPEYDEQVYKLCLLNNAITDKDIADFFNVTEQTINNWKRRYPTFFECLKEGKDNADMKVVGSLFKRAMGYDIPHEKIFQFNGQPVIVPTTKHVPPDYQSMALWLCNRQRGSWRQRQEIELSTKLVQFAGEDALED